MNEQLLFELAKAVPNLVVFLILVLVLLRGQKSILTAFQCEMRIRDVNAMELQERTNKVIVENSEALMENSKALGSVAAHLTKVA